MNRQEEFNQLPELDRKRFWRSVSAEVVHVDEAGGYEIVLDEVVVRRLTAGFLEFMWPALDWKHPFTPDMIKGDIQHKFPNSKWVLRHPPERICPPYLVMMKVRSFRSISGNPDQNSYLVVVWFADDIRGDLMAELKRQLDGLDWVKHASDLFYD